MALAIFVSEEVKNKVFERLFLSTLSWVMSVATIKRKKQPCGFHSFSKIWHFPLAFSSNSEAVQMVLGEWSFISRELESTNNYFKGAREQCRLNFRSRGAVSECNFLTSFWFGGGGGGGGQVGLVPQISFIHINSTGPTADIQLFHREVGGGVLKRKKGMG